MKKTKFPRRPTIEVIDETMPDGHVRRRVRTVFNHETRTIQEPGAGCNINNIMKQFKATGINPFVQATDPALFGSFDKSAQYGDALNVVIRARQQFEALSSDIRERFKNSEMEFLRFMESTDEKDIKESYDLRLRNKPKVEPEKVQKVEVVNVPKEEAKA